MRIEVKGLSELRRRLAQQRPEDVMARALAEQAELLAQAVRERLSEPEGASAHDTPWCRTAGLRDSIAAHATGLEATIGSNDPAAAPQELGTLRTPPRPFLAPAAADAAATIARAIGSRVAAAMKTGVQAPN